MVSSEHLSLIIAWNISNYVVKIDNDLPFFPQHDGFNWNPASASDVAVVFLSEPANIDGSDEIDTVVLATSDQGHGTFVDKTCYITGFGIYDSRYLS